MPSIWYKQEYVQGFYCGSISLLKSVNTFERMDIAEYMYEDISLPSYKNLIWKTPTVLFTAGKREENRPCRILTP